MAMSGNFINQFKTGHALYVEWSATNKIPTNNMDVTINVYVRLAAGYSIDIGSRAGSVAVGGYNTGFNGNALKYTGGDHLISSVVLSDIPHNDNGSLSATVAATYAFNMTIGGTYYGSYTASAAVDFDTIPRASLLSSFNDFQIETTAGVIGGNANVYSATFYHRFKLFQGSTEVASWDIGQLAVGAYAYALSLTATQRNAIFAAMPTIDNQLFTLQLITYNDAARTVQIGSTQAKTATGTIPVSYKPTITTANCNFSWENKNNALTAGYLIQNISTLTLLLSGGTAPIGASLAGYRIRFCTVTRAGVYSGAEISENVGLVPNFGLLYAYFAIYDSRGRWSEEINEPMAVNAYNPPLNNGFDIRRNVADPTSADYILKFSNSLYSSGNTWTYALYYLVGSTWALAKAATAIAAASIDTVYTHALPYSESSVYTVKVVLTDLFNTVEYTDTMPTSAFPISFGLEGCGFGKDTSDTYNIEAGARGISSDGPIVSKVIVGNAPLLIDSPTKVYNLNVDMLDGQHMEDFMRYQAAGNNPDIDTYRYVTSIYSLYNSAKTPEGSIGVLEVIVYSPDWVLQRWTPISSNNSSPWQRMWHSGTTWTVWKHLT